MDGVDQPKMYDEEGCCDDGREVGCHRERAELSS